MCVCVRERAMPAATKNGSRPSSSKIDVGQRPVDINNMRRTDDGDDGDERITVSDHHHQHDDGKV